MLSLSKHVGRPSLTLRQAQGDSPVIFITIYKSLLKPTLK